MRPLANTSTPKRMDGRLFLSWESKFPFPSDPNQSNKSLCNNLYRNLHFCTDCNQNFYTRSLKGCGWNNETRSFKGPLIKGTQRAKTKSASWDRMYDPHKLEQTLYPPRQHAQCVFNGFERFWRSHRASSCNGTHWSEYE